MCDDWMPGLTLPLTLEQFHQLPRHPAYKYEYLDGVAYLSPRPRHYHAVLDVQAFARRPAEEPAAEIRIQPARAEDFANLEGLFAAAFHRTQPFGSLDDATRKQAARECLERTRTGGDGPLIEPASFVATSVEKDAPVGAIFITLLPDGDPADWDSYYWSEPPPADCVERRLGRPHLTWVFTGPLSAGHGIGTALLAAAVRELLRLGFTELASTFLLGNDASMLWHWRNGFRLLPYPGSYRQMQKRIKEMTAGAEAPNKKRRDV